MLVAINRHHVFVKTGRQVELAEVGPRMEMKRELLCYYLLSWLQLTHNLPLAYEIRQGTIEQTEAEREWVLSHYTRTAKKRNAMGGSTSEPPQKKTRV